MEDSKINTHTKSAKKQSLLDEIKQVKIDRENWRESEQDDLLTCHEMYGKNDRKCKELYRLKRNKQSLLDEIKQTKINRENRCESEQDDLLMCQKMYGFNDRKCKELYMKRLNVCLKSIEN